MPGKYLEGQVFACLSLETAVMSSWTNQAFTSNQQASERLVSNALTVFTELTHQPLKFWIDGNCLEKTEPDLNAAC